jgi:phage FluMu protein Com
MTIEFECSKCAKPLRAADDMAGSNIPCPQCNTLLDIPDPAAHLWPPGVSRPSRSTPPLSSSTSPSIESLDPPETKSRSADPLWPPTKSAPAPPDQPIAAIPPHIDSAPRSTPIPESHAPIASPAAPTAAVPTAAPLAMPIAPAIPLSLPVASVSAQPLATMTAPLDHEPQAKPRARTRSVPILLPEVDEDAIRPPDRQEPARASEPAPQRPRLPAVPAGSAKLHRRGATVAAIHLGDVIASTWQIYKANTGLCVKAVLLLGLVWGGAVAIGMGTLTAAALVGGGKPPGPVTAIVGIALALVFAWLGLGLLMLMLNLAHGKPASSSDVFSGGRMLPQVLAAWAVQVGLLAAGYFGLWLTASPVFLILILLGLGIAFLLAPARWVLVDQRRDIVDSVQFALRLTAKNFVPLTALSLLTAAGVAAFSILTLGLGSVVAIGFAGLLRAVVYLRMTSQPTADERRANR